jgi:hypothetical protein
MRKEIPDRLRDAQRWGDQADALAAGTGWQMQPLVKVELPQEYARDWTLLVPPIKTAQGGAGTLLSTVAVAPNLYQPVTADYGYEGVQRPGGGTGNCILIIRYGGGKTTREAKIDYPTMGGTYAVRGSSVEVFAMFNAAAVPGLQVGAELVDAPPPAPMPEVMPMLSYVFDGVGSIPAGTAGIPGYGVCEVPVNAISVRHVQLVPYGGAADSISLEFDGIGGRSIASTAGIGGWQAIPPGASSVRILNTSATATEAMLQYAIAL